MDQKNNPKTAKPNYMIVSFNSSKRHPRFLLTSIICNYVLLILNILVIVTPLAWCLVYYTREVPVNSVGTPLYSIMSPMDFFLILYCIRLALTLIICVVSIVIFVQTSRKAKQSLLEPFFITKYQEIMKVSKSNIVVSLMVLGECILLIACVTLLVGAAFKVNGAVGVIIAGVVVIVLVSTEYAKTIGICAWLHRQQSHNKQL